MFKRKDISEKYFKSLSMWLWKQIGFFCWREQCNHPCALQEVLQQLISLINIIFNKTCEVTLSGNHILNPRSWDKSIVDNNTWFIY